MKSNKSTYSQHGQDGFVINKVFLGRRGLTFLDVGAFDGVTLSNTYLLEREYEWNGVCVEPSNTAYERLVDNRHCDCIFAAASDVEGEAEFLLVEGNSAMLSGLVEYQNAQHCERIAKESNLNGGGCKTCSVKTVILSKELAVRGIHHVHYASIDVEGGELPVLRGLLSDNIKVDLFSIENNYKNSDVALLLTKQGYTRFAKLSVDDFFIRNELLTLRLRIYGGLYLSRYYLRQVSRFVEKRISKVIKKLLASKSAKDQ